MFSMEATHYNDEELVQMTTIQLRNLLEQHIITSEQHREFRNRRRRLQNRKYARRCAKKKQTEVAELESAAKTETSAIKSLKRQLLRLSTSINRIEQEIQDLSELVHRDVPAHLPPTTFRMVSAEGADLGLASILPKSLKLDDLETSTSGQLIIPLKWEDCVESSYCIDTKRQSVGPVLLKQSRPCVPGQRHNRLSAGRKSVDINSSSKSALGPSLLSNQVLVSPAGGGFARGGRGLAD